MTRNTITTEPISVDRRRRQSTRSAKTPSKETTLVVEQETAEVAVGASVAFSRPRRTTRPSAAMVDAQLTLPLPLGCGGATIGGKATKYPRTGKRGAPQAFPRKLFEILCHEPRDIIGWTDGGTSFIIKNMDTFVVHVLMKYFRHQKYSSFQRQLNLYGFRKVSKGSDVGAYAHKAFLEDRHDLLLKVRRMPQASTSGPISPGGDKAGGEKGAGDGWFMGGEGEEGSSGGGSTSRGVAKGKRGKGKGKARKGSCKRQKGEQAGTASFAVGGGGGGGGGGSVCEESGVEGLGAGVEEKGASSEDSYYEEEEEEFEEDDDEDEEEEEDKFEDQDDHCFGQGRHNDNGDDEYDEQGSADDEDDEVGGLGGRDLTAGGEVGGGSSSARALLLAPHPVASGPGGKGLWGRVRAGSMGGFGRSHKFGESSSFGVPGGGGSGGCSNRPRSKSSGNLLVVASHAFSNVLTSTFKDNVASCFDFDEVHDDPVVGTKGLGIVASAPEIPSAKPPPPVSAAATAAGREEGAAVIADSLDAQSVVDVDTFAMEDQDFDIRDTFAAPLGVVASGGGKQLSIVTSSAAAAAAAGGGNKSPPLAVSTVNALFVSVPSFVGMGRSGGRGGAASTLTVSTAGVSAEFLASASVAASPLSARGPSNGESGFFLAPPTAVHTTTAGPLPPSHSVASSSSSLAARDAVSEETQSRVDEGCFRSGGVSTGGGGDSGSSDEEASAAVLSEVGTSVARRPGSPISTQPMTMATAVPVALPVTTAQRAQLQTLSLPLHPSASASSSSSSSASTAFPPSNLASAVGDSEAGMYRNPTAAYRDSSDRDSSSGALSLLGEVAGAARLIQNGSPDFSSDDNSSEGGTSSCTGPPQVAQPLLTSSPLPEGLSRSIDNFSFAATFTASEDKKAPPPPPLFYSSAEGQSRLAEIKMSEDVSGPAVSAAAVATATASSLDQNPRLRLRSLSVSSDDWHAAAAGFANSAVDFTVEAQPAGMAMERG